MRGDQYHVVIFSAFSQLLVHSLTSDSAGAGREASEGRGAPCGSYRERRVDNVPEGYAGSRDDMEVQYSGALVSIVTAFSEGCVELMMCLL